jgi:tight adherence protein B
VRAVRAGPRRVADAGLGDIASTVQRLAVLLAAGVAPASAWGYLAGTPVIDAVVARIATGEVIGDAIARAGAAEPHGGHAWRALAAAWTIATDAGAPLSPSLRQIAQSLRSQAQAARDIEVALAGPIATAKLVIALPVVGVLFSMALGFDTLTTLVTTPIGLACLTIGALLLLAARLWNAKLVRAARPPSHAPGLALDLTAIAVSGGASLDGASAAVAAACERFSIVDLDAERIADTLDLSRRAGVPAAELLRSEAVEQRLRAASDAQRAAARLTVTLMLPLGVCAGSRADDGGRPLLNHGHVLMVAHGSTRPRRGLYPGRGRWKCSCRHREPKKGTNP